jgi:putative FmdB family regulatory protein
MRYDFKCPKCGEVTIHTMPMSEISNYKAKCKNCTEYLKRVFNVVPVKYNGTGFYTTDYKKDNKIEKDLSYCGSSTHNNTTPAERSKILRED